MWVLFELSSRINSPEASPTQGLLGLGLLEAAQGSRKSGRALGWADPTGPFLVPVASG